MYPVVPLALGAKVRNLGPLAQHISYGQMTLFPEFPDLQPSTFDTSPYVLIKSAMRGSSNKYLVRPRDIVRERDRYRGFGGREAVCLLCKRACPEKKKKKVLTARKIYSYSKNFEPISANAGRSGP